ncbi:MAG: serine/threonine-protein phosphatase [Anaerolineaceae bacterium]|nr:serine/threonine-protein phosphatase [Anaerolineaceae bacterium]
MNNNAIIHYQAAFAQSIGKQRDHNEDSIYVNTGLSFDNSGVKAFGLFIVADGMGGYVAGEAASSAATNASAVSLIKNMMIPFISDVMTDNMMSLHEAMEKSITDAQQAVVNLAPGGGTTIITGLLLDHQLTLAHIGDSRAYFIGRDGSIVYLTKDHSIIQKLIDTGEISEDEALSHPNRNYLYKAVGRDNSVKADIVTHVFRNDSRLLLCSDGLWGVVNENKIIKIVSKAKNIQIACDQLVAEANKAGGPDNISVILVESREIAV